MSETVQLVNTRTPFKRIQDIFELAYQATNYLLDTEPIVIDTASLEHTALHELAKERLESFAGAVAIRRHSAKKPSVGNPGGLHSVHPKATIVGSLYHASRSELLTFDLVTINGHDSFGDHFVAEELVIRDNPDTYSWRDISIRRETHNRRKLEPFTYAQPLSILSDTEARFVEFTSKPDTADTTRLLLVSGPVALDR